MIQNVFIFALLFVSAGVYGSTVAPKKDAHVVRKYTQQLFHKNIQAKHKAPLAAIKAGTLTSMQRDPMEFLKSSKAKSQVAPKTATLRGASDHAGQVATESLTTAKTRLLSPNKGFVEFTFYDDAYCSTATSSSGSAVNYCYYDEETEGATSEVVVLKKFSSGLTDIVIHSLGFTDSSCTSLNVTASVAEDTNSMKSFCYSATDSNGDLAYAFKYDHVTSPTNVTSDATFSYYEYKTESGCNNWNTNTLAYYGSFTADDMGCEEYFNDGEYFKVTCTSSVVEAEVYSDSSCSTYLRNDDISDMCSSEFSTYPSRVVCESATA